MKPAKTKKQKLEEEALQLCPCSLEYSSSLEHCSFCGEACCDICSSGRKSSETRIAWEVLRIFFIGREKEIASPFHKGILPMDLFKLIFCHITRLTKPMCWYCASYCAHYRQTGAVRLEKHRCSLCRMSCCSKCWMHPCVFTDSFRYSFMWNYKPSLVSERVHLREMGLSRLLYSPPQQLKLICKDCSENFDVCRVCNTSKPHDSFLDPKFCISLSIPNCRGHKICYDCMGNFK